MKQKPILLDVNGSILLGYIKQTNAYFHLCYEDNKTVKRSFYKYKDGIIEAIIDGSIDGITAEFVAFERDKLNKITYLLTRLSSCHITIEVHTPFSKLKTLKKSLLDLPTKTYEKSFEDYMAIGGTDSSFWDGMEYIQCVYKQLLSMRIWNLSRFEFLSKLRGSCEGSNIKPVFSMPTMPDTRYVLFVSNDSKRKPLFFVNEDMLRDGVVACEKFDWPLLKDYLETYGQIKPMSL